MSNITKQTKTKDEQTRQELLQGRPLKVQLKIAFPLLLYSAVSLAFQFFDTLTVANIDQSMVSIVLLVSDIQMMFNLIFVSISIGIGIRISRHFGANDRKAISEDVSTVFFFTVMLSAAILIICILFSKQIMQLVGFPLELRSLGQIYFSLNIIGILFSSINTIYFACEKARGNTRIVSLCNTYILAMKVLLNYIVLLLIRNGTFDTSASAYLLPIVSCISFGSVAIVSLKGFLNKNSILKVSWKDVRFDKKFFIPFFTLIFPITIEKALTQMSKVICNSLYGVFGSIGLAAFACFGRISSLYATLLTAFQDSETTLISANLGNQQYDRVNKIIKDSALLTGAVGTVLFTIIAVFSKTLIGYFSKGDPMLAKYIYDIYSVQRWDFLFIIIDHVCTGYLYSIKKAKFISLVNFVKLFLIRIPLFIILTRYLNAGIEAIGIVILVSNAIDGIVTYFIYLKNKKEFDTQVKKEADSNERLLMAIRSLATYDVFDSNIINDKNAVPTEVLSIMKENYQASLNDEELIEAYRYALIEARIDELEKEERVYI